MINSMKTIIDSKRLIMVEIKDKRPFVEFVWKPFKKKKYLWDSEQKEGFYYIFSILNSSVYTAEELRNGEAFEGIKLIVEDKKVYYKPYVRLTFEEKIVKVFTFDTYDEALAFAQEKVNTGIDFRDRMTF